MANIRASGIFPNGARILDQLDCYEPIAEQSEPLRETGEHYENGDLIIERGDFIQLVAER